MTTTEQILKAFEDLSEEDKKTFKQSIQDRVDESVAAQEKAEGDENSQDAKDRVDEAIGEDKAEEKKEDTEDKDGGVTTALEALAKKIEVLEAKFDTMGRQPEEASEKDKLAKLERRFTN